jgi:hypothetical protein
MTIIPRLAPTTAGLKPRAFRPGDSFRPPAPAPILIQQAPEIEVPGVPRRTKIWELSKHLHCSVIGTCLSTSELRQLLAKTHAIAASASDHDLHSQGVLLAAQHDGAGKRLNKALDKRHRLAVNRFAKAKSTDDVRGLWREAVKRGEIPGGYWAALTHSATSEALARECFDEVHMLSHLVGAAGRADIRRLSALEAENAALRDKARRQEEQLRHGMSARDAKIRELGALLSRRIAETAGKSQGEEDPGERATLGKLIGDLERRVSGESSRRVALEARLQRLAQELDGERQRSADAARREAALRQELDAIEARLSPGTEGAAAGTAAEDLAGLSLLYVGGRPSQVSHLRALSEKLGAQFVHHDGGVEERSGALAGLVSRADIVMFPIDCVSHEAALGVKRLCRQAAKPYMPLRSTGLTSFMAALGAREIAQLRLDASLAS